MRSKSQLDVLFYLLLRTDLILAFIYIVFRADVLTALLSTFDIVAKSPDFDRYRFLVWGGLLFSICTACSFYRQKRFSASKSLVKGILAFELMIFFAIALSVKTALSQSEIIDPYWITKLSFISYLFEMSTVIGAGYVFADFLLRLRSIFHRSDRN